MVAIVASASRWGVVVCFSGARAILLFFVVVITIQ